jgi:hypothetical protein
MHSRLLPRCPVKNTANRGPTETARNSARKSHCDGSKWYTDICGYAACTGTTRGMGPDMTRRQRRNRRHRFSRSVYLAAGGSGLTAAAVLLSGSVAEGIPTGMVTVNTLSDSGAPSATIQTHETLADAIDYLNASSSGGTILFKSGLSGAIHLKSALPTITKSVDIKGPGASKLTIDGGGHFQIFEINDGPIENEISGLTLERGTAPNGGAIETYSELELSDSTLLDNYASDGGAVFSDGGGLEIAYSTFEHNTARYGSAIDGSNSTTVELSIENSTIAYNTAKSGFGAVDANFGTEAFIFSSTIAHNTSKLHEGGGVYALDGLQLEDSTIVNNSAPNSDGGGIFSRSPSAGLEIFNSIVADNSAATDPDILNSSTGSNVDTSLIGDGTDVGTALVTHSGDITGTGSVRAQPKLGKLANNGGPTPTMMPLKGSRVINKGDSFETSDQRGFGRPVVLPGVKTTTFGNGADMGAVEVQTGPQAFSTTAGDLKLSVKLPFTSCIAHFADLPPSFAVKKHGGGAKMTFKSVAFFLDKTSQPGKVSASATSTRSKVTPQLSLASLFAGEHTLSVVVTTTHKRHHKTVKGTTTLKVPFNICTPPELI